MTTITTGDKLRAVRLSLPSPHRKGRPMSQHELAAVSLVSQGNVSRYENGKTPLKPSYGLLVELLARFVIRKAA